jgi:AcrR family transcriptional regulator
VPKLWNETIEAHRHQVRDAILDTTAALVFEHGLRSVTMAQIAERTGIGRATLYKYFPDVDTILHAWHHRQITAHLTQLTEARDNVSDPGQRLDVVLRTYARIAHETRNRHNTEIGRFLHRDEHLAEAQRQLHDLIANLIAKAADAADIRADMPADELASYCLHALNAASSMPSQAAVDRLVTITLAGLRALDSPRPVQPSTDDGLGPMSPEG